jgi:NhaP-type Na+/H+ or K+/H+ antiporter
MTGLAAGFLIGFSMHFFRKFGNTFKAVLMITIVFSVILISELSGFTESKFICIIVFGYMCFCMWGHHKPDEELSFVWQFFMPLLFGTIGAAIRFDQINAVDIVTAVSLTLFGVTCRWFGAFIATWQKKFTVKERMFMAFSWIPKATVQAALGAIVLEQAVLKGPWAEEFLPYG